MMIYIGEKELALLVIFIYAIVFVFGYCFGYVVGKRNG